MTIDNPDFGPTPPPWCQPGAKPDWELTPDGAGILDWCRDVGGVWIARADRIDENGEWTHDRGAIYFSEAPRHGLTAAAARQLAAELLAAADLLDR